MSSTSAMHTTTTSSKLFFFSWSGWEEESSDTHRFGMIASSKEEAIRLILENLLRQKGATEYKSQVYSKLKQKGTPVADWPVLSQLSDPKTVNWSGPWTALPDRFLDGKSIAARDNEAMTIQEFFSKVDPMIYPIEEGLAFFASALQG